MCVTIHVYFIVQSVKRSHNPPDFGFSYHSSIKGPVLLGEMAHFKTKAVLM